MICGLALLLLFQNCSQSDNSLDAFGEGEDTAPVSQKFLSEVLGAPQKIDLPNTGSFDQVSGSFVQTHKQVDLENQIVLVVDTSTGAEVSRTCPSSDLFAELDVFFNSAQVCEFPDAPPGTVCTLQFITPHAQISDGNSSLELGQTGVCDGFVDFCAADKAVYDQHLQNLLADQSSCS